MKVKTHFCKVLCDKCSKSVHPKEDTIVWMFMRQAILEGEDPIQAMKSGRLKHFIKTYSCRHLHPTDDCVGSPSSASVLDHGKISYDFGQRLPKEEWKDVDPTTVEAGKKAWKIMQETEWVEEEEDEDTILRRMLENNHEEK